MPNNKESFWKRFFNSPFFLFAAIVVAVLIAISYARTYYQDYQIRQDIKRLRENERSLQAKKSELLDILRYVKSPLFVEEKARTDLNMGKIGEKMTVINSSSSSAEYRQSVDSMVRFNNLSNYMKWWNYFMGVKK